MISFVGICVISNHASLGRNSPGCIRISLYVGTDEEKGGLDVIGFQYVQYEGGIRIVWTVIKRQRDYLFQTIGFVINLTEYGRCRYVITIGQDADKYMGRLIFK
jgi:hypothetical protein